MTEDLDVIDRVIQAKQEAAEAAAVAAKLMGVKLDNPYLDFLKANCLMTRDQLYGKTQCFHSCPFPDWHNKLGNIMLGDWSDLSGRQYPITKREEIVKRYSWAIPNEQAIMEIVNSGLVIEIGAGTGYWGHLVRSAGGTIDLYDIAPLKGNAFTDGTSWMPVSIGGPEILKSGYHHFHSELTLFLCWPPYGSSMASACLENYFGSKVIYVGEQGGCTGDEKFQEMLDSEWNLENIIEIPVWWGVHDAMYVYTRKLK